MKQIKTWLTTMVVLLCSGTINAASYDFEVDGIFYAVNKGSDLTVSVVNGNYEGDVVIPESVTYESETYTVTSIQGSSYLGANGHWSNSSGAFAYSKITSIKLPSTITEIGDGAFYSSKNLKSIVVPNNVQRLGQCCFENCDELREVFLIGKVLPVVYRCTFAKSHVSRKIYVVNRQKTIEVSSWSSYSDEIKEYITFDQNDFNYNGQVPTITYTNNLANKYELTMEIEGVAKDAGTHETTFKAIYSNGLEVDIPYTYSINKAPLDIKVNDAEKIYGDENPKFTYSFSGFVNNEDESVLSSAVAFSTKANKKSGAGTYSVSASATAKNYEVGCTEGTLTVKKAPVTVAVNAKSRVYGDANPQFDFTYVGLKNGDGVPVFTSELNTSTKATKYSAVGDYEVTVSGGVAANYAFTEYIPGTLTVTQAPLSISVQSTVREYGEANPEFKFAYSGFKNDDDADCLTTAPAVVTSATPTSSVGEYEITPNGAEATNYAISYTSGTLTVNKAPLTIQAEAAERMYGEANPKFTFACSGFKNEETYDVLTDRPSAKTEAIATSAVGTYEIVPSGAEAQNYDITYKNGILTVTKAPLSVSAVSNTKEYGETNPKVALTYRGFKNNDNEDCISKKPTVAIAADRLSDVGEYAITVSGGKAQNYEFTEYNEGVLTVEKAPLTVIADNKKRLYFEANPEFTFHCEGFKNEDTKSVITSEPSFECSAKQTSSVGEYEITPNGAEATNYVISYTNGTLTVNKAPLTIQVENAERVYGDENPKFTFAYSGFKNEETYDVLSERPSAKTEAITTSGVGTYNIVPSGAEAQNYDITYKNGTLTVTKAPLSVSAVSNTKEYGETNPKVALTYSGFKNNDNEDCISEKPTVAIAADRLSDVGEYAITVSGGKAQNYEFAEYNEGVLTVEKAPLTVIADNKERLYFEANPEFTYHCKGFKNEDTKSVITTEPSFECSAKQTSSVGEYDITLSGAEAKNYELSYQGATLTIGKQTIDVKVGNYTRIYNEENPQFEMSYSGFVNNENEKVFAVMPTIQCEADKTTDVGAYEIIASGGEAVNYDFNYASGTLTIEKAAQEIVWEQDLTTIAIGDQVELTAIATSGLAIEYELATNNIVSIYEAAGKIYLDCFGAGEVMIKAIQQGNKNYHSAVRVSKKLVVTDPSGVESVITNSEDAPIYKLQGERMIGSRKELQKGIYIQNGRKFVVK